MVRRGRHRAVRHDVRTDSRGRGTGELPTGDTLAAATFCGEDRTGQLRVVLGATAGVADLPPIVRKRPPKSKDDRGRDRPVAPQPSPAPHPDRNARIRGEPAATSAAGPRRERCETAGMVCPTGRYGGAGPDRV